jgi:hypothetical protein
MEAEQKQESHLGFRLQQHAKQTTDSSDAETDKQHREEEKKQSRRTTLATACNTTRKRPVISTTDSSDVVMDAISVPYMLEMRFSSATEVYTTCGWIFWGG